MPSGMGRKYSAYGNLCSRARRTSRATFGKCNRLSARRSIARTTSLRNIEANPFPLLSYPSCASISSTVPRARRRSDGSWTAFFQLDLQIVPGDCSRPIGLERLEAPRQLGRLRRGQGEVGVIQAVPKVADERDALLRAQGSGLRPAVSSEVIRLMAAILAPLGAVDSNMGFGGCRNPDVVARRGESTARAKWTLPKEKPSQGGLLTSGQRDGSRRRCAGTG